eukprot:scaffold58983_cov66-Phaeocystis_antarctica.AAC.1
MERWPLRAASMSAVVPTLSFKSTLAPRFSSSLTISSWPWAAATWSSRGSEAGELTASGAAAGDAAAGCGGAACCRMSFADGAAVAVEQLSVGLGSQQGLHARLLTLASGQHQGGIAVAGLQVGVGRVLQQSEHDGEVAVARCIHERGSAEATLQVDTRASLQQLPHHLQLAVGCSDVKQADGCGLTVTCWNRAERVGPPSLAQPLDHLLQLASRHQLVNLEGQRGGRARRGLVSVRWGSRRGGGRLRRRC